MERGGRSRKGFGPYGEEGGWVVLALGGSF